MISEQLCLLESPLFAGGGLCLACTFLCPACTSLLHVPKPAGQQSASHWGNWTGDVLPSGAERMTEPAKISEKDEEDLRGVEGG